VRFTQTCFNERVEEGGEVWRGEWKREQGDVWAWDVRRQVASCPPLLISSAGTHKTQHTTSRSTSRLLSIQGARKSQTTSFSVQSLNNQQFLTAPWTGSGFSSALPPTHRLNPHRSRLTGFSLLGCSYTTLVLLLKLCKGHKSQKIQSAQDFFLVQFTNILSILALQDPYIIFISKHAYSTLTGLDLFVLNFNV